MKKAILLPLLLGLALTGCSRTSTNANKVSSNNQDPNKPIYDSQTATAKSDAAKQAEVAAANSTTPTPAAPEAAATPATTPAPTPATTEVAATTPPPATTPAITPAPEPSSIEVPKTTTETATAAAKSEGTPTATTDVSSDKNEAKTASTDISARIAEWKLAPDDIRTEQEAGKIVRSKTVGAGEPTGPMDDVLLDQVKGKLQSDPTTGQLKFDVKADKGVITLQGSAHTLEQIGTALALSLDTPGVTQAVSEIKIESKQQP